MCTQDLSGYLHISRPALQKNAETVVSYVGVPVIGVVKCDGYGISIKEAAMAWKLAGVTMFAVSDPREALELRREGFREDILLMSPVADADTLNALLESNIMLTITGLDSARFYSLHANCLPIRVHVAIDTGMGRFGIRWTDTEQLEAIYALAGFIFEGIFSHFAKSFEKTYSYTQLQLNRFLDVTDTLAVAGYPVGIRHIANSCAALRFPQTRLDAVRIGSALVGKLCTESPIPLQQAAVFWARVVDCKTFLPGDTTGYAAVCKIRCHTKAVIVAIGSEDGFGCIGRPDAFGFRDMLSYFVNLIRLSLHRPCVVFQGRQLPLIGRIGSQYTLFDATNVDIRLGDYVCAEVPLLLSNRKRVMIPDT